MICFVIEVVLVCIVCIDMYLWWRRPIGRWHFFNKIKSMSAAFGLLARGTFIQIGKKGREIEKSGHGQINLRVFVMESEISPVQWRLGKAGS